MLVIVVLTILCFSCKEEKTKEIIFSTDISADATPAVLASIMKVQDNSISVIKFEKGTYHFFPEKGKEEYCYISNHRDGMVRTAFPLKGLDNLTVDGQGSTFIFHGIMIPFLVEESKDITIKNVSIDWEDPFNSEGLIVDRDEEKKTFDIKISENYPYEIRNGELVFIKPYYEHGIGQSICFDPQRSAIAFNTEEYTGLTSTRKVGVSRYLENVKYKYGHDRKSLEFGFRGSENRLVAEEIEPGLVRIHNHGKKMPKLGWIISMKGDKRLNRLAPAFRVKFVNGFNAENVNVHHAGGMGIIAENSRDLILDNFNIVPSQGRMVSTTADATHFVGCRGKIEMKNCTFNNQLDDASNIHGVYQKIVDILDDNRLGVYMGHHQQQGFVIGTPNDTLGLVRLSDSFFPYKKLTIKNIEFLNGRYQIITFNEKLPEKIKIGDLLENLSAYPEVLIKNCNIGNNRARGILVSTPKKTVIEDNFFHTEMEGILVPLESGHWYESGNAANLFIRNNTFQDCQHSGYNRGVIRFDTDDDNENVAFKNIEITNNTFNQFDNLILQATNTDGILFKGNTITNSGTFPQRNPQNPVIKIKASKNVRFEDNSYDSKATEIIQSDSHISNGN